MKLGHAIAVGYALVLAVALPIGVPTAQAVEPIAPDRPGQADPATVLDPGVAQIEMAFTFSRETDGKDTDTWTVPEPLLRVGVFERVELRLAADGLVVIDERSGKTESTGSDFELATKVRILEQAGWLPATSLLAGLSFPTGGRAVTSDGYDPFATLIASWDIGERFAFDANIGIADPSQGWDDSDRVVETFGAASLGVSLSDRFGTFLGYFTTLRGSGEDDEHSMDTGVTFLVTDDLQLDVTGGAGLNQAAPNFFVGVGVAWRFWPR